MFKQRPRRSFSTVQHPRFRMPSASTWGSCPVAPPINGRATCQSRGSGFASSRPTRRRACRRTNQVGKLRDIWQRILSRVRALSGIATSRTIHGDKTRASASTAWPPGPVTCTRRVMCDCLWITVSLVFVEAC